MKSLCLYPRHARPLFEPEGGNSHALWIRRSLVRPGVNEVKRRFPNVLKVRGTFSELSVSKAVMNFWYTLSMSWLFFKYCLLLLLIKVLFNFFVLFCFFFVFFVFFCWGFWLLLFFGGVFVECVGGVFVFCLFVWICLWVFFVVFFI